MERWTYGAGAWCVFVKNLDETSTRVYVPTKTEGETVVEFATDEDMTMFLLKWC